MENKNKGLVVAVIVLAACVLGLVGYIVYERATTKNNQEPKEVVNDKQNETKDNNSGNDNTGMTEEQLQEIYKIEYDKLLAKQESISKSELEASLLSGNDNYTIAKNTITKLLAYLNLEVSSSSDSTCVYINYYFDAGDMIKGNNIFNSIAPSVLTCFNNIEYNGALGYYSLERFILVSPEQYNSLNQYFTELPVFKDLDSHYAQKVNDPDIGSEYSQLKLYFNKNYSYVIYPEPNYEALFESKEVTKLSDTKFEVELISYAKKNDTYQQGNDGELIPYPNPNPYSKYVGKLTLEVNNNQVKFGSLEMHKAQ